MCGICGFTWEDSLLVSRMMEKLVHRGPDSSGSFADEGITLGHQRLAIIDLSPKGHQPMSNKEGTTWVTFNGEIYNFKQLRSILEQKGHVFESNSDTEVIVHAYDEYGEDCVQRLEGQFAFAIWDSAKRRLFCARDRLGIKPFYYALTSATDDSQHAQLIFASEMKAILEHDQFAAPTINPVALDRYFTYRYTPGDDTVIFGIKKLRPGHSLIFEKGEAHTKQYWTLAYEANSRSVTENAQIVLGQLTKAVRERMVSDVPLGAYLSGGLDSSAIVALMAEQSDDPIKTFSVSFPYEKEDEGKYARRVAEEFKTDHHQLEVKKDAFSVLPKVLWHLDEPLADASCIPTYLMSELTKKYVTVVLSGEGSDELFAGYDKYKYAMMVRHARRAPSALAKLMPGGQSIMLDRLKSIVASAKSDEESYEQMIAVFSDKEKKEVYTDSLWTTIGDTNKLRPWKTTIPKTQDALSMMLATDTKTWLPDDLLLKGDKMTLAHAVEGRNPFLDHRLVEIAASIPSSQKLKGQADKFIYRKAISKLLPKEILARKKHGFFVPIGAWLQNDLKDIAHQALTNPDVLTFLNHSAIDKALKNHTKHIYYKRQLWTMLSFALWHRIFIEKVNPANIL